MKWGNNHTLILILVVGAILRFWNYVEVPFINDEFSALFRTEFNSFSELIEKGVVVDGHPPAVQVFLYYWTSMWGTSEWIVKLPFTLLGIGSIYLLFLVAKQWFNETVGLISASFIACLQHPVMYSQIARPYVVGLFFSLLAVFFWTKYLKSDKAFTPSFLGFILSAAVCLYVHHFSGLFVIIVGASGFFFLPARRLLPYLSSVVGVGLLYLPNVQILTTQLSYKGLASWLAPPTIDFPFKYIAFLGNFSYYILLVVIGIVSLGLFLRKNSKVDVKKQLLFGAWFLIPILVGYIYSVKVAPVLQYTVLIFSFPYLLFVLFGHVKDLKPSQNRIAIVVIICVITLSTVYERKHYSLFYETAFAHVVQDFDQIQLKDKVLAIVNSRQKMTGYYQKKLNLTHDFLWLDSLGSTKDLEHFLSINAGKYKEVYFGGLHFSDPSIVPILSTYYPYLTWQKNYATGTTYLFSKDNNTSQIIDKVTSSINFAGVNKGESYVGKEEEWGPSFEFLLDTLYENKNDLIDVEVWVKLEDWSKELVLVNQVEVNGEQICWNGRSPQEYQIMENGWVRIINTIKVSDLKLPLLGEPHLKTYFWNKGKGKYEAKDLKVTKRKGNPFLYGLFSRI